MNDPWKPIFLVVRDDLAACAADAPSDVAAVVFEVFRSGAVFHVDGVELAAEAVYRDAVATVTASSAGEAQRALLAKFWAERFGAPLPDLIDLAKPGTSLCAALSGRLVAALRVSQSRSARLMKELALLRKDADQTQTAFARLEAFFYQTGKAERTPDVSFPEQPGQRPVLLTSSRPVEQRMPTESTGLCDVSFRVVAAPAKGSKLTAQIELLESCRIIAEWHLGSEHLAKGWVRLALPRALGTDAQTPVLRLIWTGEEPLKLSASFPHPDPRFRATEDSAMLAMHTWKYIPGAAPLLSADGIPASRSGLTDQWSISSQALRDAVNLSPDPAAFEFTSWNDGLCVRPAGNLTAAARLNAVAHPGLAHLTGGIKTEAAEGPDVEYAYALAPVTGRPRSVGQLPEFAAGMTSEWMRLPAGKWSEQHLFLKEPLTQVCDLYLLTRLADPSTAEGPANACFYKILGHARPKREGDVNVG